ncbi:MAG TPA: sorbosone dehydrogenase family protein [Burkholderiales bacterium]
MPSRMRRTLLMLAGAALALAACGDVARLPEQAVVGPNPEIAPPSKSVLPTVDIAPAMGWPEGVKPRAAPGTQVAAFARDLAHPRWLYVLPNGDVLVAETNAPPKPEDGKGLRGKAMKQVMKKAGAAVPSQNRITLLRDADGDGVAEVRQPFLEGLNSPFGMALVGDDFYVANTDSIVRFHYEPGATRAAGPGVKIVDLPGGPLNHHWTKNLIASPDGKKLYVTVGSNSNAAENGLDQEHGRAAIWEVELPTGQHRVFASGLRNPNGLAWEPRTGELWTVVNERDELGSDLVPDFLTSVKDGGFYGWPYSYYGRHVDDRVEPQRPDLVAKALVPDYALGPHVAALGLAATDGGMYVGEHGSWNRKPPSGYKVVFVPFEDGRPSGRPHTVLDGFISPDGDAYGRPVGVAFDHRGGLLVADDVGNTIWRVSAAPQVTSR